MVVSVQDDGDAQDEDVRREVVVSGF